MFFALIFGFKTITQGKNERKHIKSPTISRFQTFFENKIQKNTFFKQAKLNVRSYPPNENFQIWYVK